MVIYACRSGLSISVVPRRQSQSFTKTVVYKGTKCDTDQGSSAKLHFSSLVGYIFRSFYPYSSFMVFESIVTMPENSKLPKGRCYAQITFSLVSVDETKLTIILYKWFIMHIFNKTSITFISQIHCIFIRISKENDIPKKKEQISAAQIITGLY